MSSWLNRLCLSAVAFCLPLAAHAEPELRHEGNLSIRNEVQLAIDKGLAHLESTQRADGTWGKTGVTGFALMALQRDPRGRYRGDEPLPVMEKGYAALQHVFLAGENPQTMDDFTWNAPPAVLALRAAPQPLGNPQGRRNNEAWARGYNSLSLRKPIGHWNGKLPDLPETLALYQAAWEKKQFLISQAPKPPAGSRTAAWIFSQIDTGGTQRTDPKVTAAVAQLGKDYTLERNPGGESVHQYYFWLGAALVALDTPALTATDGHQFDVPRLLAEKLINDQNANGSWDGVGEAWMEKDPDLVTSYCLLALEAIYGLL